MTLPPIEVAFELVADGEFGEALSVVDNHLALNDSVGDLHALRALLLVEMSRLPEATEAITQALVLDPEDPHVQQAAAEVSLARLEPAEAIAAARRALALDPDDDESVLLEARALMLLGQWDEVLSRTEYILAGDSENEPASILRAIALEAQVEGKGRLEAGDWEDLARRFPLNPFARTAYASRLLMRHDYHAAGEQYRQALTIDPNSAWAKEGLVLALKARYPGYGLLLGYALWLHRLPPRTRTWVAIGGVVGFSLLRRTTEANPFLQPLTTPIIALYIVMLAATWLADPLLNLVLMWHPEGRTVLSRDDKESGVLVGVSLAAGIVLALIGMLSPWEGAFLAALGFGAASFTIPGAYSCDPGRYRRRLLGAAGVFAVLGLAAAVTPARVTTILTGVLIVGFVASTWAARGWAERSYAA
jgi:tetratricopeptide (TPR) repeat protein